MDSSEESQVELQVDRYASVAETVSALNQILGLYQRHLPGPYDSLEVMRLGVEECRVEWRRAAMRFRQQPPLNRGLWTFQQGKKLYCIKDKPKVVEGKAGPLERPAIAKVYKCNANLVECSTSELTSVFKEALLQRRLESKYICRLLSVSVREGRVTQFQVELLMERLDRDLKADMEGRVPYEEEELLRILRAVAGAMVFAKQLGVAHRDIKPSNIFKSESVYKLGDFGSACAAGQKAIRGNGTSDYLSPEMRRNMNGECIEMDFHQSDIYSLGVTMLHLAALKVPGVSTAGIINAAALEEAVQRDLQRLPYSPPFLQLLQQMLLTNPKKRPLVEEVQLRVQSLIRVGGRSSAAFPPRQISELPDERELDTMLDTVRQLCASKRLQEAEDTLLEVLRNRHILSEEKQRVLTMMLAHFYLLCNRFSESKALLEEMIQEDTRKSRPIAVQVLFDMTELSLKEGTANEVEILLRESLQSHLQSPQPSGEVIIMHFIYLGRVYMCQGRAEEAKATLQDALPLANLFFGERSKEMAHFHAIMGVFSAAWGNFEQGEEYIRSSIELFTEIYGEGSSALLNPYILLINNQLQQNKLEEAHTLFQVVLDIQPHDDTGFFCVQTTMILLKVMSREPDELQETLNLLQSNQKVCLSRNFLEDRLSVLFTLLEIDCKVESQRDEAEQLCTKILEMPDTEDNFMALAAGYCQYILGNLQRIKMNPAKAEDYYKKSRECLLKVLPHGHTLIQDISNALACTYFCQGKLVDAKLLLRNLPVLNPGIGEQNWKDVDYVNAFVNEKDTAIVRQLYEQSKRQFGESHELTQLCQFYMSNSLEDIGNAMLKLILA